MLTATSEKPLEQKIADNSRRLSAQVDCQGRPLTAEQCANLMIVIASQYARLESEQAKAARRQERELNRTLKPKTNARTKIRAKQKTRKSLKKTA